MWGGFLYPVALPFSSKGSRGSLGQVGSLLTQSGGLTPSPNSRGDSGELYDKKAGLTSSSATDTS